MIIEIFENYSDSLIFEKFSSPFRHKPSMNIVTGFKQNGDGNISKVKKSLYEILTIFDFD